MRFGADDYIFLVGAVFGHLSSVARSINEPIYSRPRRHRRYLVVQRRQRASCYHQSRPRVQGDLMDEAAKSLYHCIEITMRSVARQGLFIHTPVPLFAIIQISEQLYIDQAR